MNKEESKKVKIVLISFSVILLLISPIIYNSYVSQIKIDVVNGNYSDYETRVEKLNLVIQLKKNDNNAKHLLIQEFCRNNKFQEALNYLNSISTYDNIRFSTIKGMIYELQNKEDSSRFYYENALLLFEKKMEGKAQFSIYRLNILMLLNRFETANEELSKYQISKDYDSFYDTYNPINEFDRQRFINSELGMPNQLN
ncbi:hypothetical protein KEM09_00330 [Carboxylicivirga mesophila]|uniref:Tetratricopeptide repeat-like domain-containing protein n=1 Tax=Carboxylicivirga mesophila TaxID=1166478 RepID=A0ABS5K471_9BACT|nr:hypothetical protein [Carboxylicivirga mesophila]MBS2209829.1 hypothetical protein [Carboxylicivirga mesophila]